MKQDLIFPKYLRRLPSVEALIPALYLKGVSTGNMEEVLIAILGKNAQGLSATNIVRLKQIWEKEYEEWQTYCNGYSRSKKRKRE